MAFRGARREPADERGRPHRRLSAVALAAVLVALSVVVVTGRATGSGPTRCETFAADSAARAGAVSGAGEDLLVIGDSWTAGLGLDDPTRSWTARLPGRVHTADGTLVRGRASEALAGELAQYAVAPQA